MTYEKSDWFKGLIFAEKMHQEGWFVEGLDYETQSFVWRHSEYEQSTVVIFNGRNWIDGVRDFYKNRKAHL